MEQEKDNELMKLYANIQEVKKKLGDDGLLSRCFQIPFYFCPCSAEYYAEEFSPCQPASPKEDALTSLPSRQRTQSPLAMLRRPVGTPR